MGRGQAGWGCPHIQDPTQCPSCLRVLSLYQKLHSPAATSITLKNKTKQKQINKKKLPVLPDDSYGTGMVVHWSYAVLHALIYCSCLLSSEGSVINVEQLVCGQLLFASGLLTDS